MSSKSHAIFPFENVLLLKDRRTIMPSLRSFDSNSTSTTLKETRIDNRMERTNSLSSGSKYNRIPPQRQDSIDEVPDISNNNQDVRISSIST